MNLSRRTFILGAGVGTAGLLMGKASPSNRITVGVIGIGTPDRAYESSAVLLHAGCTGDGALRRRYVAPGQRQEAGGGRLRPAIDLRQFKGCTTYKDFTNCSPIRRLDAVFIGGPDHWHVRMSMEAIKAGKDVSCEKPITRCIADGRRLERPGEETRPRLPHG